MNRLLLVIVPATLLVVFVAPIVVAFIRAIGSINIALVH